MPTLHRQHFFNKQVYMKVWKDNMAGKNEEAVLEILKSWGYKLDKDFFRQYPVGDLYVIDFAFPFEKVAIEVDGPSHNLKANLKKDKIRDSNLTYNGWVIIRIEESIFFKDPRFYKYFLHEVIEERKTTFVKHSDNFIELK